MDITTSSLDTRENPGADTKRLASTSSFHTVAPKMVTCDVVGVGQSSHIQNPAATGTDLTRLHRLHEAGKVKLYQSHKRDASVGNYLSVIDKGNDEPNNSM